jgi:hypothetical protein
MSKGLTPEEHYNQFWKEIVENPDGSINKEQLMLELMDFSEMIGRMSSLACNISNGVLSYPTYSIDTMIEFHNNTIEETYEAGFKEGYKQGKKE